MGQSTKTFLKGSLKYDISYALEDNTKLQAKKNKFGHCQDQELFSFTFKTLHLNIVGHEENSTKR